MWSSIANLKENLHKIALDVHDDEELQIYNSPARESPPFSDRRFAHTPAHSSPASRSPRANGFDSPYDSEIEQYRSEIKRLQESEAEIKAMSVNYAALLKEKEDWISRLDAENRSLKQNLDATNAALNASRNESFKTSANNLNGLKGTNDQSPSRQHKAILKNRSVGNQANNGAVSKQDGLSNGVGQSMQPDFTHNKTEVKRYGQDREKELADLLEEKNRSLVAIQAASESKIQKLGFELQKEQEKLADVQLRLQEEQKLNGSIQDELNSLKMDKDKTVTEMNKVNAELSEKITEVGRLQMELNRRENEKTDEIAENLKRVIAALEKENNNLKMEKVQLEAALQAASNSSVHKIPHGAQENSNKQSANLNENMQPFGSFPGKQEMELNLQKVEKDLNETRQQRDKALQELNRLKKHLLDKELEESEKMDEDSKIIEDLREKNEYQRLQILHLEKALKQAIASQEEAQMANKNELQKCNEIIDDLNRKLKSYTSTIDAKNIELLNLQTALGQYYAEIEAKEELEGDLALAREESAKLSELLKDAHQQADIYRREKEDILEKLSRAETIIADGRNRIHKLEEDNAKILRALEQSMSRINRMSMDSDYYVDAGFQNGLSPVSGLRCRCGPGGRERERERGASARKMDGDTELYQHLHKLAAINSEEQLESLFVTLWRTRKTGVSPSEKASLQSLLNLQAAGQLDPVLACLHSLTRKCVHENFSSADILKLFPPDLPLGLQNILILLFQKYQSQWKEEMTREQHPLPRTSVSHQVNADFPTFPSSDMLASPWPRQDNPIATITADTNISNMASIPPQCDAGRTDNLGILPRLKSMTWKLENQSKTSSNRVAVITLKLQDYTKSPSGQMEVKFQLTRDSLEAVLRSMTYISEQLSSLVGSSTGPLQKKHKQ